MDKRGRGQTDRLRTLTSGSVTDRAKYGSIGEMKCLFRVRASDVRRSSLHSMNAQPLKSEVSSAEGRNICEKCSTTGSSLRLVFPCGRSALLCASCAHLFVELLNRRDRHGTGADGRFYVISAKETGRAVHLVVLSGTGADPSAAKESGRAAAPGVTAPPRGPPPGRRQSLRRHSRPREAHRSFAAPTCWQDDAAPCPPREPLAAARRARHASLPGRDKALEAAAAGARRRAAAQLWRAARSTSAPMLAPPAPPAAWQRGGRGGAPAAAKRAASDEGGARGAGRWRAETLRCCSTEPPGRFAQMEWVRAPCPRRLRLLQRSVQGTESRESHRAYALPPQRA